MGKIDVITYKYVIMSCNIYSHIHNTSHDVDKLV